MRIWVSILLLWAVGTALSIPAWADFDQPPAVLYPVTGHGEIAPNIDLRALKHGEKPLEIPHKALSTLNNAYISITSDTFLRKSAVGCHQVMAKQSFCFNLVDTPNSGSPSAEDYISVRSGRPSVAVGQDPDFTQDLASYLRSETPPC